MLQYFKGILQEIFIIRKGYRKTDLNKAQKLADLHDHAVVVRCNESNLIDILFPRELGGG